MTQVELPIDETLERELHRAFERRNVSCKQDQNRFERRILNARVKMNKSTRLLCVLDVIKHVNVVRVCSAWIVRANASGCAREVYDEF